MEQKNINSQENGTRSASPLALFTLLAVFYAAACIYIPLSLTVSMGDWLTLVAALGICIFSAVALTKMAGSFKPLFGYAIVVGAFILFGGAVVPMALLVAAVSAVCVYAYLLIESSYGIVWVLPILPMLVCAFITKSMVGILLSLVTLPAAYILALCITKKHSRISAVCRISAAICFTVTLLIAACVYRLYGVISIKALISLIDTAKEQLTLMLHAVLDEVEAMLGGDIGISALEDIPELAVASLFNLLPGVIITLANIAAYIIHSLYINANYALDKEKRKEALPMLVFDMSLISAIIYIASLVLSFILVSDSTALYGAVAENLMLILAPGLVLTALAGVRALSMRKGPSCLGTLLYFALIFMIASLSPIVISVVALAGAVFIIFMNIAGKSQE